MKAFLSITAQFFVQIRSDLMLAVLFAAPLMMGSVFYFGVPPLEDFLCDYFEKQAILTPYYPLFDLVLIIMTPLLFTSAGAMVILDEADLGLTRAVSVTPVGRLGYLGSRIGVPAVLSIVVCVAVTLIFGLSGLSLRILLPLALCSGAFGVFEALFITSFSGNKVEGLALSKFSGLFMAGIPISVLVPAPAKYLSGVLPTFWMTEFITGECSLCILPAFAVVLLWIAVPVRKFKRKILI